MHIPAVKARILSLQRSNFLALLDGMSFSSMAM